MFSSTCLDENLKEMSKIPISAVYPTGVELTLNVSASQAPHQTFVNRSKPIVDLPKGSVNDFLSPVSLCVEGFYLWLLLVWVTAGTVSMIFLVVRPCRKR